MIGVMPCLCLYRMGVMFSGHLGPEPQALDFGRKDWLGAPSHGARHECFSSGEGRRCCIKPGIPVEAAVSGGCVVCSGSLQSTNEPVVAASELQEARRQIKRLEQALGRKTLGNDLLREAVDFSKPKKWLARPPVLPEGGQ